jgi:RNase P subunit RPR2
MEIAASANPLDVGSWVKHTTCPKCGSILTEEVEFLSGDSENSQKPTMKCLDCGTFSRVKAMIYA